MAEATGNKVNERAAALLNEIRARAAEAHETDLVARINVEVELWNSRETTVVIVGEPNRGKSTLLNALLDMGSLVPADARFSTEVYVVVRHGPEPVALVHIDGRREPVRVAVGNLGRWITGQSSDGSRVRGVEVRLPHPLLERGLLLVDTPGFGGLDSAHGRVSLATLRRADALLFVTDPDAPLSAPELRFLGAATERVSRVVFVLSKIDAYRGWRRVLEDDQRALANAAPRFANACWCPVSSRLKTMSEELGQAGGADPNLVTESGIPALLKTIDVEILGRTASLRLANLLLVAGAALAVLGSGPINALEALKGEPEGQAIIARESQRLEELRDAAEQAQLRVSDQFNLLRDLMQSKLNQHLRTLADHYESDPKVAKTATEFVNAIEAELQAMDLDLESTIEREALRIQDEATTVLGIDALGVSIDARSGLRDLVPSSETGSAKGAVDPTARMRIVTALTSSGTTGALAAKYAASSPEIAVLMGLGMVLGLATTFLSARVGRKQRDLQTARGTVRATLDQCRAEAAPQLRQAVLEVQREVEGALRRYVRSETKRLQGTVAEAQQVLRADVTRRQQIKAEAERRMSALNKANEELHRLQELVAAALDG